MSLWRGVKRRLKEAVLPLLFLSLCGYFAWHAVHGDRGLLARDQRLQQIADAQTTLAAAQSKLESMERRVDGLRGDHIDRDQLDERARAQLNLVQPNDIVIPYSPSQRLY